MTSGTHKPRSPGIGELLKNQRVRRIEQEGAETLYSALDIVGALADPNQASDIWEHLKRAEPQLARQVRSADFPADERRPASRDGLTLAGVFRLIESIPSPQAERLKNWIAQSARDHLLEAENPEMLALRARRIYERRGYSRRWVDKRLRGVNARQELTGEWYRRGATDGEQFRDLTNRLMRKAFGMDVEQYRRYKNLGGGESLRDHMSDLELALTSLGETAAVALHQARQSNSFSDLQADTEDAGRIVARTRKQIERLSERSVITASRHGASTAEHASRRSRRGPAHPGQPQRRTPGGSELAEQSEDMQNPSPAHPSHSAHGGDELSSKAG